MSPETYDFILALLISSRDELIATKSHLDHQLSLKPAWRVTELSDTDMEDSLENINLQIYENEQAELEFKKARPY